MLFLSVLRCSSFYAYVLCDVCLTGLVSSRILAKSGSSKRTVRWRQGFTEDDHAQKAAIAPKPCNLIVYAFTLFYDITLKIAGKFPP